MLLLFIKNGGFAAVGFWSGFAAPKPIICFTLFLYFCLFCFIFLVGDNAGCENTPFFYTQAARAIL